MFEAFKRAMLVGATLGILLGAGSWYITSQKSDSSTEKLAVSTLSAVPTAVDVATLVVQLDDNNRRLLWCQDQRCQTQPAPIASTQDAVFDGQWWYYYGVGALQRASASSSRRGTIVEKTPLVAPRDLIISPDGRYLAYWLDNISKPKRELTELWVYDTAAESTYVVAEKLTRSDMHTKVRWNRAATHLWFLGDTAEPDKPDRLELLVTSIKPPAISARFSSVDWSELQDTVGGSVMDISPDGTALAYVRQITPQQSELVAVREGRNPATITVRGTVPYLQWFEDGSLFYAVQDARGATFWQHSGAVSRHMARSTGVLLAAHGRPAGDYVAFIEKAGMSMHLRLLHVESGGIADQGAIPEFGERMHIAKVELTQPVDASIAGISTQLDDAQLAAFIERHLPTIAKTPSARPIRLIVTDQPNTVYVDFNDGTRLPKRLLLVVQDAINPEWSTLARYESTGGEWKRVRGGGVNEPTPLRLYEWEEKPGQWILKEKYQVPNSK